MRSGSGVFNPLRDAQSTPRHVSHPAESHLLIARRKNTVAHTDPARPAPQHTANAAPECIAVDGDDPDQNQASTKLASVAESPNAPDPALAAAAATVMAVSGLVKKPRWSSSTERSVTPCFPEAATLFSGSS